MNLVRTRFYKRPRRELLFIVAVLGLLLTRLVVVASRKVESVPLVPGRYIVASVQPDLTLCLQSKSGAVFPVRILGIESSESAKIQKLAYGFLLAHLLEQSVDVRLDRRRKLDQEYLAHVYFQQTLLSESLIAQGLVKTFSHGSDNSTISRHLRKVERKVVFP